MYIGREAIRLAAILSLSGVIPTVTQAAIILPGGELSAWALAQEGGGTGISSAPPLPEQSIIVSPLDLNQYGEARARMPDANTFGAMSTVTQTFNGMHIHTGASSSLTAIYSASHPTDPTFGAVIPVAFDGSLSGSFGHLLPDAFIHGEMYASVKLSLDVFAISGGMSQVATFRSEQFYNWDSTNQTFILAPMMNDVVSVYAGIADGGQLFEPDSFHPLLNSNIELPDEFMVDLQGDIPFTAVSGQDYAMQFRIDTEVFAENLLFSDSSSSISMSSDFFNTATLNLAPAPGSGGQIDIIAVPEPKITVLIGIVMATMMMRRSR